VVVVRRVASWPGPVVVVAAVAAAVSRMLGVDVVGVAIGLTCVLGLRHRTGVVGLGPGDTRPVVEETLGTELHGEDTALGAGQRVSGVVVDCIVVVVVVVVAAEVVGVRYRISMVLLSVVVRAGWARLRDRTGSGVSLPLVEVEVAEGLLWTGKVPARNMKGCRHVRPASVVEEAVFERPENLEAGHCSLASGPERAGAEVQEVVLACVAAVALEEVVLVDGRQRGALSRTHLEGWLGSRVLLIYPKM